MNIDNAAYQATNSLPFVLDAHYSGRDTAWVLRGLLAGAKHFPNDPTYNYLALTDTVVNGILAYYGSTGLLTEYPAVDRRAGLPVSPAPDELPMTLSRVWRTRANAIITNAGERART